MQGWRLLLVLIVIVLAGCTLPFGGTGDDAGADATVESEDGVSDTETDSADTDEDNDATTNETVSTFEVTQTDPGEISVTDDEFIEVTATVENTGTVGGTSTVELVIAGEVRDSAVVTLEPDHSETVDFSTGTGTLDGEYTFTIQTDDDTATGPVTVEMIRDPTFEIVDFDPRQTTIDHGDRFDVTATIENTGDRTGTQPVRLTLDGTRTGTQDLTLASGESQTLRLTADTGELTAEDTFGIETRNDRAVGDLTIDLSAEQVQQRNRYEAFGEDIAANINDSSREIEFTGHATNHSVSSVSADVEKDGTLYVTMDYEDGFATHQSAAFAGVVIAHEANLVWYDVNFDEEERANRLPREVEVRFRDDNDQIRLNYTVETTAAIDYYHNDITRGEYANQTIGDYDEQYSNYRLTEVHGLQADAELYHSAHFFKNAVMASSAFNDSDTAVTTSYQRETIRVYATWDEKGDITLGRTLMLQIAAGYTDNAAVPNLPRGGYDFYLRNEAEPDGPDILGHTVLPDIWDYQASAQTNDDLIELIEASATSQLKSDDKIENPFGVET